MSDGIRCFVAVAVPEQVREAVAGHFAREGRGAAGVSWVRAANLHLTLKFLGEVSAQRLPELTQALAGAVGGQAPFELELCGAGAFPPGPRPRVLWVGAGAGAAELTALAHAVERALAPLGFPPEGRPFSPHLTVGRVKTAPRDPAALRGVLDAARALRWGRFLVPEVHLVRSQLFPAGAIYSILNTTRLPHALGRDDEGAPTDG